jgi:hypothetical protein
MFAGGREPIVGAALAAAQLTPSAHRDSAPGWNVSSHRGFFGVASRPASGPQGTLYGPRKRSPLK